MTPKKIKCMKMLMMTNDELIDFIKESDIDMYNILKDDVVNPLTDEAICHYIKKVAQNVIDDEVTTFNVIDKKGNKKVLIEYLGD